MLSLLHESEITINEGWYYINKAVPGLTQPLIHWTNKKGARNIITAGYIEATPKGMWRPTAISLTRKAGTLAGLAGTRDIGFVLDGADLKGRIKIHRFVDRDYGWEKAFKYPKYGPRGVEDEQEEHIPTRPWTQKRKRIKRKSEDIPKIPLRMIKAILISGDNNFHPDPKTAEIVEKGNAPILVYRSKDSTNIKKVKRWDIEL